jgi:hypothetical protein
MCSHKKERSDKKEPDPNNHLKPQTTLRTRPGSVTGKKQKLVTSLTPEDVSVALKNKKWDTLAVDHKVGEQQC